MSLLCSGWAASGPAPSCGQHRKDVVSDALLVADLGAGLVALLGVILYELLVRFHDRGGATGCSRRRSSRHFGAPAQPLLCERAGSTVNSPNKPSAGVQRPPAFARYWNMKTLQPVGATLYWTPGTSASQSSTACTWDCAGSTAYLASVIATMTAPRKARFPEDFLGAIGRKARTYRWSRIIY